MIAAMVVGEGDEERHRVAAGALGARHRQRAEEHEAGDERPDCEQDQAEVERRVRAHRRVGRKHHARIAAQHRVVVDERPDHYQPEPDPGHRRRREAASRSVEAAKYNTAISKKMIQNTSMLSPSP